MNNQTHWTKAILTCGLVFVTLALIVAVVGLLLPSLVRGITLPEGMVPGISIMLLVLGIAGLAQYAYVRRNPNAGKQMRIREQDERLQAIRDRAGHRAFGISSALAFLILLWVAFAGDVGLPQLSGSSLFFALLIMVGVPYLAYIIMIAAEQNNR